MTDTHTIAHIPDEAVQAAAEATKGIIPEDFLITALTAALPHLSAPCAVEVKKLEWQEPTKETNGCWTAKCPIGTYSVVNENGWYAVLDEYAWGVAGFEWSSTDLSKDTRQTAFDAAQSDFERRILSCVVTKPVDVAAVRMRAENVIVNERDYRQKQLDDYAGDDFVQKERFRVAVQVLNIVLKEIRALSAEPAQGDQWQPIETVPMDGTKVDLWCSHVLHGSVRAPDARYHINNWVIGDLEERLNPDWIPTHWMPLPAAPTAEAG